MTGDAIRQQHWPNVLFELISLRNGRFLAGDRNST
jgi:hypothetical protein